MKDRAKIVGILLTLTGGILWGFSGACGQYLFIYKQINADLLVPYRLLISGLAIVLFYIFKSPKISLAPIKDRSLLFSLFIYGIIGLMMTQYSYFYAIELSNAAIATVIQYTAPAMILVFICIREQRWIKTHELIALLLAIFGVTLLATHGDLNSFVISKKALLFAFLSAIGACFYNLAPTKLNQKYPVALVLGWGMIIGGVTLSLYMQVWKLNGINDIESFLAFFSVIFFGTILSFSFYMTGVKILGPAKASLIACIEPISAALFAYFWLHTKIVLLDLIGFALIISCVILTIKNNRH